MPIFVQLVVLLALLSAALVTGRLLVCALRIRRLRRLGPESAAATTVLGAAALTLGFGLASGLGRLPARPALVLVAVAFLPAWLLSLRRGRAWSPRPRASVPGWLTLAGSAALVSYLALLPVRRAEGFLAGNDTFEYCALSDWLQDHGMSQPAHPEPDRPIAAVAALRQQSSVLLGATYPLALARAGGPAATSLAVYPAVSAFGLVLGLLALLCASRVLVHASWVATAAAAFGFAFAPHAGYWAHHNGFLSQTHAVPLLLLGLVALGGGRGLRDRSGLVLVSFSAGSLLIVYLPFVPLLGAAALAHAAAVAVHADRRTRMRVLGRLGMASALALLLAGFDAVSAVRGLHRLLASEPGAHVPLSPLGLAAVALGPGPGATAYVPRALPPGAAALTAGAALLTGIGFATWRSRPMGGLLAALVPLALLVVWNAFVRDPWSGERGQTWSLFKTVQWAFPLLLLVQLAGLAWLARRARGIEALFVAGALALAPGHWPFSEVAGRGLAGLVDDDRPLRALPGIVDRLHELPPGHILWLGQAAAVSPFRAGYAALLAWPRPTVADWEGSASVHVEPEGPLSYWSLVDRIGDPDVVPVLVDAPPFDTDGRRDLGGGYAHLLAVDRPRLVQAVAPARRHGRPISVGPPFLVVGGPGRTKLLVLAPRDGPVEMDLDIESRPGSHAARVFYQVVAGSLTGAGFHARVRETTRRPLDLVGGSPARLRIEARRGLFTVALTREGQPLRLAGVVLR